MRPGDVLGDAQPQADAASLIHSQAFRAQASGEFVNICETGVIMNKHYGRTVSAVNVGYPERLAARTDQFKEFDRMMKESVEYALKNRDAAVTLFRAAQADVLQLMIRKGHQFAQ